MNQRQLGYLFAASLAVLALAIWVAHRHQPGHAARTGELVLPGLEASLNEVTRVQIAGPGGVQATLEKGTAQWAVSERGYPADSGKLRKLLLDLASLKIIETKTRLAQNYPVLGVQDLAKTGADGVRIDVVSPEKTWSLIVGHTVDGNECYVRLVGHRQSLLASPMLMANAKPGSWLDPPVVDLHQDRVRLIEERPASGPAFTAVRAKAGEHFAVRGIPRGRKLASADAADDMASALANLTLDDVRKTAPPPHGVHEAHARFETFDGLAIGVTGYQDGTGGPHYIEIAASAAAKSAGAEAARIAARVGGWQYRIPGYRYDEIFQRLSGLLAPLPARARRAHSIAHRVPTKKKTA